NHVLSPLCYPGVKSRVIKMISPPLPQNFSEFYEPFAGGGVAKQKDCNNTEFVINDLNFDLYCFLKEAKGLKQV
ncbi:MAG: DNA adenine methylase, partial [Treponema sp.]|nr:DNA adenine methylase [Treponema sp.]